MSVWSAVSFIIIISNAIACIEKIRFRFTRLALKV